MNENLTAHLHASSWIVFSFSTILFESFFIAEQVDLTLG